MTKTFKHSLIAAMAAIACMTAAPATAQETIKVTGFVYDLTKSKDSGHKEPIETSRNQAIIYAYDSKESAQQVLDAMLEAMHDGMMSSGVIMHTDNATNTNEKAQFEIEVPSDGALLIKYGFHEPVLVPVNNQKHIEVGIDTSERLEAVTTTASRKGVGKITITDLGETTDTDNPSTQE